MIIEIPFKFTNLKLIFPITTIRNRICRHHITLQPKFKKNWYTTIIQLLYNYLLGITTILQLSLLKMMY